MDSTYTDPLLAGTKGSTGMSKSHHTSQIIGSALMGAAIGAATMILTDRQKREVVNQKAKDIGGRMKSAVNAMKNGEKRMMNDTVDTVTDTADAVLKTDNTVL